MLIIQEHQGMLQSNVVKQSLTITWSNPADITYGTALSNTQLNASSSVPGTFTYTPVSGTVLSAGTHTLNVDFTPLIMLIIPEHQGMLQSMSVKRLLQ